MKEVLNSGGNLTYFVTGRCGLFFGLQISKFLIFLDLGLVPLFLGSQNISSYFFGLKNFHDYFSSNLLHLS